MARTTEIARRLEETLDRPPSRPLAILGRSGAGKTHLLRSVVEKGARDVAWGNARDLVLQMTEAIRDDHYPRYRASFSGDERPLCIEHLEDLRGKAATRAEVQRLLVERTARRRSTVLTMTRARGDAEVVEWLASWADLLVLD
jgi:chromosomal replication initiation ATPase DnaA